MQFLLLLAFIGAGALIAWLSILGGIWFLMPIFLGCAAVVSYRLDNIVRWRIAAFGVGLLVVFGFQVNQFVQSIDEANKTLKNHKVKIRPTSTPVR